MEKFELGLAAQRIYDFIWSEFCDWYIEMAKPRLYGEDDALKAHTCAVLRKVLIDALKMLHPFMPFITEEIFQALPHKGDFLMTAQWPEYQEALNFPVEEASMQAVMDTIKSIRARRAEMNVPPSKKAEVLLVTATPEIYQQGLHFIQRLAYASEVTFATAAPADVTSLVSVVTANATAYMPLAELVDLQAELDRINKEIEKAKNGLRIVEGKLNNEKFVSKAPEAVVNAEKEKAAKYAELIAKLEESAKALQA
jgi:valyl-tRNA synthetase